jgi:hypothetical protein
MLMIAAEDKYTPPPQRMWLTAGVGGLGELLALGGDGRGDVRVRDDAADAEGRNSEVHVAERAVRAVAVGPAGVEERMQAGAGAREAEAGEDLEREERQKARGHGLHDDGEADGARGPQVSVHGEERARGAVDGPDGGGEEQPRGEGGERGEGGGGGHRACSGGKRRGARSGGAGKAKRYIR